LRLKSPSAARYRQVCSEECDAEINGVDDVGTNGIAFEIDSVQPSVVDATIGGAVAAGGCGVDGAGVGVADDDAGGAVGNGGSGAASAATSEPYAIVALGAPVVGLG
jgi:hypothetical protein